MDDDPDLHSQPISYEQVQRAHSKSVRNKTGEILKSPETQETQTFDDFRQQTATISTLELSADDFSAFQQEGYRNVVITKESTGAADRHQPEETIIQLFLENGTVTVFKILDYGNDDIVVAVPTPDTNMTARFGLGKSDEEIEALEESDSEYDRGHDILILDDLRELRTSERYQLDRLLLSSGL